MENLEARKIRKKILNLVFYLESNQNGEDVNKRANEISMLENLTNTKFGNTAKLMEGIDTIKYGMVKAKGLEDARINKNLTIKQLARKLKMPEFWVNQMERGERKLNTKAEKFVTDEKE